MRTVDRRELGAFLALLTVTAAWGSTFFMIKDIVGRLPVADLLAVRFALASLALLVCSIGRLRLDRRTLRRGALLGVLYGIAQILQTAGLAHTSASVSGFVTGLYVVATPLLSALILRTAIPRTTWLAAILATIGLGVLSLNGFTIGYGELLTLASAIVYALHIVALGQLSDGIDALSLSLVQLVMITICCSVAALPGGITLPSTPTDWMIVLYLAIVAGALTMVAQTWAQARIDASRAAVIMALEPVWAALFAVTLGGESITARMIIGGLAILSAIYLVELAPRWLSRREGAHQT
ncbi:MAG TPA: DMT family transporter [Microlunatus sp.]|nr:DMT family transporter [Microlunatus sp.]